MIRLLLISTFKPLTHFSTILQLLLNTQAHTHTERSNTTLTCTLSVHLHVMSWVYIGSGSH